MLIDLPCARCGRYTWLPWADYLDAVASDNPRRNWPYICRHCRAQRTTEPHEEAPRC